MTSSNLRLLRLGCIVLAGLCLYVLYVPNNQVAGFVATLSKSDASESRRIEAAIAAIASLLPFAALGLLGAISPITKAIKAAEERETKQWERDSAIRIREADAAEAAQREQRGRVYKEQLRLAGEARKRAVTAARTSYPDYIDEDALEELGWRDDELDGADGSEANPIEALLDPPEIVLNYRVPDDEHDCGLSLYLRERVSRLEGHPSVKTYRDHAMKRRAEELRIADVRRRELEQEQEKERLAAEEAERIRHAEKALRQERAERMKQQKIVRLDD